MGKNKYIYINTNRGFSNCYPSLPECNKENLRRGVMNRVEEDYDVVMITMMMMMMMMMMMIVEK